MHTATRKREAAWTAVKACHHEDDIDNDGDSFHHNVTMNVYMFFKQKGGSSMCFLDGECSLAEPGVKLRWFPCQLEEDAANIVALRGLGTVLDFGVFSFEAKESQPSEPTSSQPSFDAATLKKFVPPRYLKFINNLESEIVNVSMEKETLKIEVVEN
ncbi:hypothetical protein Tco_0788326 [Tanacetum coccineum]